MDLPSNASPAGCVPTVIGAAGTPVVALTFVTLLEPKFATQRFVPSKASADGWRFRR